MRAAKVQASLRIRAVSPEPPLLAHTSSESRGIVRQKARSMAPLIGWACAVKICHDGMLEDTNSLDGAQMIPAYFQINFVVVIMLVYKYTGSNKFRKVQGYRYTICRLDITDLKNNNLQYTDMYMHQGRIQPGCTGCTCTPLVSEYMFIVCSMLEAP